MKKERFLTFIEDNILSMFTGSEIIGEEESTPRDACVAQGTGGALLVKFKRSDTYRFVIKRVQPFKTFEISLVKSIIEEIANIYTNRVSDDFIRGLENLVIEKAICKALTNSASGTLSTLTQHFMANRWRNSGRLYFIWTPKSLQMLTAAMKLKDASSLAAKL